MCLVWYVIITSLMWLFLSFQHSYCSKLQACTISKLFLRKNNYWVCLGGVSASAPIASVIVTEQHKSSDTRIMLPCYATGYLYSKLPMSSTGNLLWLCGTVVNRIIPRSAKVAFLCHWVLVHKTYTDVILQNTSTPFCILSQQLGIFLLAFYNRIAHN